MKLSETINIKKGDVVSIVGAGGKTTLMFTLAEELKVSSRVLVTTTTKIYVPQKFQYDFLILKEYLKESYENQFNHIYNKDKEQLINKKSGIYVYGSTINEDWKLIGIDDEDLSKEVLNYDYTVIEADGSKRKPIKAWNDDEPVVSDLTTKTIGVLSGEVINLEINENSVHRIKVFEKLTSSKEGQIMNKENILSLIFNKDGLFKKSKGNRILFINKIDDKEKFHEIESLINGILEANKEYKLLDEIIVGSLINKEYKSVY